MGSKKILIVGVVFVALIFLLGVIGGGVAIYLNSRNDKEDVFDDTHMYDNEDNAHNDNPVASQFIDSRNAVRQSDVMVLLNAISQYTLENDGVLPSRIQVCGVYNVFIGTGNGNVDLSEILVPTYLVAIPTDPSEGSSENTGYVVCSTETGGVKVYAPLAEGGKTIEVMR